MESIETQSYSNKRLIVSVDNEASLEYVSQYPKIHKIIQLNATDFSEFGHYKYNLYCNFLLEQVENGWLYFMDDDTIFKDSFSLARLASYATNKKKLYLFRTVINNNNGTQSVVPGEKDFNKPICFGLLDTLGIFLNADIGKHFQWQAVPGGDFHYLLDMLLAYGFDRLSPINEVIAWHPNGAGLGMPTDIY
jgi:hypothetical protein